MSLWKINQNGPIKVSETQLKKEKVLEDKLEDWIVKEPALLEERVLIVGRRIKFPDVKDELDILALDPLGNAVIIELKRGKLKDPVDMQALKYASYISKWGYEEFEKQAITYLGKEGNPEFNFNEWFEKFCNDAGVDEIPDINSDQRIILVGSEVKDKLGSVAQWLLDHKIDIKVIEVEVFNEETRMFVQPQVIIPWPVSKFKDIGRAGGDVSKPWLSDGQSWHLNKRCSPKTSEMLKKLNQIIQNNFEVEGPRWNQKGYVAYRVGAYNWLGIGTRSSILVLHFNVKAGVFDQSDLAKCLDIEEYLKAQSLSDKLVLPSSVIIEKRNEAIDRIILRIKEEFDLEKGAFIDFLKSAYKEFPK